MGLYIDLDRDDFFEEGVAPRQRKVYLMRWNPSASGFTRDDFDKYFNYYKGKIEKIENSDIVWTIWEWREVMHRDLFVMMQVGQEQNGIIWGGFLNGAPFQYENENGKLTRTRFIECTVMYMHKLEKTNILTADRLMKEIPEVDWLHGHAGELLSTEVAEKLGLLLVDELRKIDECDDVYFDTYNQKQYVLADILTFMCPDLKKRLLALGKNEAKDITDINELMIHIDDEDYANWEKLEAHMHLEALNGVLI